MALGRKRKLRGAIISCSCTLSGEGTLEVASFPSLTLGEGPGGAAHNSCVPPCGRDFCQHLGHIWDAGKTAQGLEDSTLGGLSPLLSQEALCRQVHTCYKGT